MADIEGVHKEWDADEFIRDRLRTTGKLLLDPDAGPEMLRKPDGTRKPQEKALKPTIPMLMLNDRPIGIVLKKVGKDTSTEKVPGIPAILRELQLLYAMYTQCDESEEEMALEIWDIKRACQAVKEKGWKLASRPCKDLQSSCLGRSQFFQVLNCLQSQLIGCSCWGVALITNVGMRGGG